MPRICRVARCFLLISCLAGLFCLSGCAIFSKKEPKNDADPAAEAVLERERTEQEKMSDYAASAGRANPREKKEANKGETFLLSDTAKDIYNNLER